MMKINSNNYICHLWDGGQLAETFSPSLKGAFLHLSQNHNSSPLGDGSND